ncbi:MAG: hypothetical protein LBE25_13360 [Arthrobacter sp.]|jgi:hypothetical protein|nr:hypothetical protein [Arthrobacter sp.]
MNPLLQFTSHVGGKNATVSVFPDRIEWSKKGYKIAHATKATMTAGLSLLGGKKDESEMVPMKAISHVATKRDGLMNSKVVLSTAGGQLEFRVSHAEAKQVQQVVQQAMLSA